MDTVVLGVADRKSINERIIRACEAGKSAKEAYISFETLEHMWQVLSGKRLALLKAMCDAGALGLRELSRRLGRDVKAVYTDTRILLNAGVIDRTEDGKLLFPYRHVKIYAEFEAEQPMAKAA